MGNQYRTINGQVYKVIPVGKDPGDRIAARERARHIEHKTRKLKESKNPFDRHAYQIMPAWAAADQRERRKKRAESIRAGIIFAIIILFAVITAVIWFGW